MIQASVRWAALAALAVLAACAGNEAPPPAIDPAPPPPPPPVAPRDQCGAAEMAYLVGQPRSQIPVPVNPGLRRVTCTSCPVTMDYNPRRLNILFDADTQIIKEVKCG